MKSKIFLAVAVSVFWCFLANCSAQSLCRSPVQEGWCWIDSPDKLYGKETSGSFTELHCKMRERRKRLQNTLPIKKLESNCIVLACLSLVLRPANGKGVPKIVHTNVLENYAFISGKLELNSKEKHSGENNGSASTSDELVKTEEKAAETQQSSSNNSQKKKTSEWQLRPINSSVQYIYELYRENKQSGPDDKMPYIVLPNHDSCSNFFMQPYINKRICKLYEGVLDAKLSSKAQLAKEWDSIESGEDEEGNNITWNWYKRASQARPDHSGQLKGTVENYFDGHADSEQKLIYLLNDITDCLEEFNTLGEILDQIIKNLKACPTYKTEFVRTLMGCGTDSSVPIAGDQEGKSNGQTSKKNNSQINDQRSNARTLRQKLEDTGKHLRQLLAEQEALGPAIEKLRARIDSFACALKLAKGRRESENFSKLSEIFSKGEEIARGLLFDVDIEKKGKQSFVEIEKKIRQLEEYRDKDYFKTHTIIEEFRKEVSEALKKNSSHCVGTIVLNLHSTHDCCANCSPDLSREICSSYALSTNASTSSSTEPLFGSARFVEYFRKCAQKLDRKNPKPDFNLIFSCSNIRPNKWDKCCRPDPLPEVSSQEIRMFQWHIPDDLLPPKSAEEPLNDDDAKDTPVSSGENDDG